MEPATVAAVVDFIEKASKFVQIGRKLSSVSTIFARSFQEHIENTFLKCSHIKTIINPAQPIKLLDHYINISFKYKDRIVDDYAFIESIREKRRAIITGTGGGGKTIFTKYIWLSFFENPQGHIPVYIELRRFNDVKDQNFVQFLYYELLLSSSKISQENLSDAIKEGLFAFIFDGFDELSDDKRSLVEREILNLGRASPKNIVLVTSRPDERFSGWLEYELYKVLPLSKKQVVDLIEKLEFDPAIKKKFKRRVEADLYEKHKSFLSTPLLAIMMLLTFGNFADVPDKVHIFYEQAFQTLFSRHDATKESFKRKMYTSLTIDQFKELFSQFALVSYFESRYEFSDAQLLLTARKAVTMASIDVDVQEFLRDCRESVCLLQSEGLMTTFTHRSFQEYFAAYGLSKLPPEKFSAAIGHVSVRFFDLVIPILYDMNKELLMEKVIRPKLENICGRLPKKTDRKAVSKYLSLFFDQIAIFIHIKHGYIDVNPIDVREDYYFVAHFGRLFSDQLSSDWLHGVREKENGPLTRAFLSQCGPVKASDSVLICSYPNKYELKRNGGFRSVVLDVDAEWFRKTPIAVGIRKEIQQLNNLRRHVEEESEKKKISIREILGI